MSVGWVCCGSSVLNFLTYQSHNRHHYDHTTIAGVVDNNPRPLWLWSAYLAIAGTALSRVIWVPQGRYGRHLDWLNEDKPLADASHKTLGQEAVLVIKAIEIMADLVTLNRIIGGERNPIIANLYDDQLAVAAVTCRALCHVFGCGKKPKPDANMGRHCAVFNVLVRCTLGSTSSKKCR